MFRFPRRNCAPDTACFAGKFSELVTPVLGERQTAALLEAISAFEEVDDMTAFTRLTAPGETRLSGAPWMSGAVIVPDSLDQKVEGTLSA